MCGLTGVRLQLAVPPVQYERIVRAGFCGGFVVQWFMVATVRTLGLSPAVAVFSLFSFLPEQVEFHALKPLYDIICMLQLVNVAMDTVTVTMTMQLLPMHCNICIGTHTDSG